GPLVQVMDPAIGRRWMLGRRLMEEVHAHTQTVPAKAWHEWALSDDFRRPLARRLRALGLRRSGLALIPKVAAAPTWRGAPLLDAATAFIARLVRTGGLQRGQQVERILCSVLEQALSNTGGGEKTVPDVYWSVRPAASSPDGEENVRFTGAILVRVRSLSPTQTDETAPSVPLGPELRAALAE